MQLNDFLMAPVPGALSSGSAGPGSLIPTDPRSPEEAVIALVMQVGRRLRTRHPEDDVDPSTIPIAKQLIHNGPMRLSDIATGCSLDASTISRQVRQLEVKGYVERTPDPADGRASLIRLSNTGDAAMRATMRRRYERIKAALEPWSEHDRGLLTELLTRLARDLGEANDRAVADSAPQERTPQDPASQDPAPQESVTR
jgi:DNA-binding MarR family transcriptional regulator